MSRIAILAAAGLCVAAGAARAEDYRWFVRGGLARIVFSESASVSLGGAPVPGGDGRLADNTGFGLELGRRFGDHWTVAFAAGVPPTTDLTAAGSLAGTGRLGSATYGPAVLSAAYVFTPGARIRPYLGAGVSYTVILDTEDAALRNLSLDNAFGPALVAGVEASLTDRLSAYVDVKKVWVETDATFDLPTPAGLVPGRASLDLDPLIAVVGLSWRF